MIPVCEPVVTGREIELVLDCLRTGWISSAGKYLERFETEWARYCGMEHGVAVSNGTVALQIAMQIIGLKPGDEVIMPTFTIISCAQAVTALGGVPVLVDSDPRNWQMDVSQIEHRITPRTRAILVVHIYGHPADVDPIRTIAQNHGLLVVEDAAEVHGAEYRGRHCGGLGDISTFSFYANKLVTTGEGGMVLARRADWAERARSLRNLCFQKSRRFLHEELGNNFRFTNLQAALGVAQIERLAQIVSRKREIAQAYAERLQGVSALELPVEEPWARNVYWVYGMVLKETAGMDAAGAMERLARKGVETRPFFLGMHEQPVFHRMGLFRGEHHPVAERLARRGFYIPSGLALKTGDIDAVADAVREVLQ